MIKYLNFSQEFYLALYKANKLSKGQIIKPIHILLGICTTKNLVSLLLNISEQHLLNYFKIKINNYICYSTLKFSKESLNLISNLFIKNNIINTIDCFRELIKINDIYIKYFFKYIKINNLNIYNLFITKSNILYIKNLFYYINFKNYIIGRNKEINLIIDIITNKIKNNIILIGNLGIGRFSIIKEVFIKIKINNKYIKDFYVLDLIQLMIILSYEDLNFIKQQFYNWLKININIILILPNLEYNNNDILVQILNIIFLLVKQKKLQVIITTTNINNISIFINSYTDLLQFYEQLLIKELSNIDIFKITKYKIYQYEKFYKIKISNEIINKIIDNCNLYIKNKVFPLKVIEFIDIICKKFKNQYPNKTYLTDIYFNIIINTIELISYNIIYKNKQILIKNFKFLLQKKIFGQEFIIDKINNSLKRILTGFKTENKPLGSWLLCGPSGTGKTELAKSITEILFGDEKKMIRFDMSEFMEKHSISKLIGSPPGYIGYGDKGLLTDAVIKQPCCLLLFDEIEKAHVDILNIMLQILDDGRLTDSTGQTVDFSNTLIILTSNLGCPKQISEFKKEIIYNSIVYKVNEKFIINSIKQYFRPELINRIQDILIFQPLSFNILLLILNKFINKFLIDLKIQKFPLKIIIQENLKKYLVKLSSSPIYGARPLKRIFDTLIVEPTIDILLRIKIKQSHILSYTLDNNKNIKYNLISN